MSKKEIAKETLFDIFIDTAQNIGSNVGSHLIGQAGMSAASEIIANTALDTGVSALPILGDAIQSYRINKRFERQEKLLELLQERLDYYTERTEAPLEEKQKYSDLLEVALQSVTDYSQEEKIHYLTEGLVTLFNTDKLSFDMGYLYIQTLNELTLLDIGVLKFYYDLIYKSEGTIQTYEDVLSEFNIEYYQYEAVRDNLYRRGLFRQKNERNVEKDFKNISDNLERLDENVATLYKFLEDMLKGKKNNRLHRFKKGKVKFETSNRYELSKFGREFNEYFLKNSHETS